MVKSRASILTCCALLSLAAAAPSTSGSVSSHPVIEPMPGAVLVGKPYYHEFGVIPVPYRQGGRWLERKVYGGYVHLGYTFRDSAEELDTSITPTSILDYYEAEVGRLGGRVHRRSSGSMSFSVPRPADAGLTWCNLWAKAGKYGIDIIDEPGEGGAGLPDEQGHTGRR